jgi:uncharacterized membrane-anchored protein
MSPLVWLFILLVSVLAAFFASLLTHALASDLGVLLILAIIAGVGWYLFGPRPHRKPGTDHAPSA